MVRGGQGVAGLGAVQPGDAGEIAGDAGGQGALQFAEGGREGSDADLGLVEGPGLVAGVVESVAGYVHRVVGVKGAGEDADEREPADVGVGGRLDDLGGQGALRVAVQGGERGAVQRGDGGQGAFERGGETPGDQVEQFDGADALASAVGGGRGGEDGVEGAACDGTFEVVDECPDVDGGAAEVAVHQGLVLALGDDPLDQPVAGVGQGRLLGRGGRAFPPFPVRVVEDPPGEQSRESGQRGVSVRGLGTVHRQVEGEHGVGVVAAEDLAADPGHRVEGGAGGVQVGDDDGARHADRRALLPDSTGRAGDGVGLLGGRDDEQGRVRRAQTGPEFPDEVGVTGAVQQIDLDPVPFHGDEGERDGALPALFDPVVVGDRGAVLDPARPVDRPRGLCECLDEGGLAGSAVADQHHVPDGGGVAGRRCSCGGSGVRVCPVAHDACLPGGGAGRGPAGAGWGSGCTGTGEPPRRLRRRPR